MMLLVLASIQGGLDIVPVRLRNAVLRILGRSKYRHFYLQQLPPPPGAAAGKPVGIPGQGMPPHPATPPRDYSPFGRSAAPETTALSHPGNMYGLMVGSPPARTMHSFTALEHAIADLCCSSSPLR